MGIIQKYHVKVCFQQLQKVFDLSKDFLYGTWRFSFSLHRVEDFSFYAHYLIKYNTRT